MLFFTTREGNSIKFAVFHVPAPGPRVTLAVSSGACVIDKLWPTSFQIVGHLFRIKSESSRLAFPAGMTDHQLLIALQKIKRFTGTNAADVQGFKHLTKKSVTALRVSAASFGLGTMLTIPPRPACDNTS